jgi:hypothetical protein
MKLPTYRVHYASAFTITRRSFAYVSEPPLGYCVCMGVCVCVCVCVWVGVCVLSGAGARPGGTEQDPLAADGCKGCKGVGEALVKPKAKTGLGPTVSTMLREQTNV